LRPAELKKEWRKTSQYHLPGIKPSFSEGRYNIYPAFKMKDDQIFYGFDTFAEEVMKHRIVILDGYIGIF
jgi:hypothetical protein